MWLSHMIQNDAIARAVHMPKTDHSTRMTTCGFPHCHIYTRVYVLHTMLRFPPRHQSIKRVATLCSHVAFPHGSRPQMDFPHESGLSVQPDMWLTHINLGDPCSFPHRSVSHVAFPHEPICWMHI